VAHSGSAHFREMGALELVRPVILERGSVSAGDLFTPCAPLHLKAGGRERL
jgi:hypothetical protein